MPRPRARLLVAPLCLFVVCAAARADESSSSQLAAKALASCEEGRRATDREVRETDFKRGQGLAEQAVALDERNPDAHFALFCNMGELMRIDGESISSMLG